jgi:hypothetical protein
MSGQQRPVLPKARLNYIHRDQGYAVSERFCLF